MNDTPPPPEPESIAVVFAHYRDQTTRHLAAAVAEADEFPSEILNEVRGAFTHLAKADGFTPTSPSYLSEVRSASRHLKRASLDSLKLSILSVVKKIEERIDALEAVGFILPESAYSEIRVLKQRRMALLHTESSHPSTTSVADIESLYVDLSGYSSSLTDEYSGEQATALRRQREQQKAEALRHEKRSFWKGIGIGGVLVGIPLGLVTNALYDLLKPFLHIS